MRREDPRPVELRQQLQHLVEIGLARAVESAAERNVDAQHHGARPGHIAQILFQPLELPVEKTARVGIAARRLVDNVVHRDEVDVAPREGVVDRPERGFVSTLRREVGHLRKLVVVVADRLEDGNRRLAPRHRLDHIGIEFPFVAHDVAQRDRIGGQSVRLGRHVGVDVGDGLRLETVDLRRGGHLRVADGQHAEFCLLGLTGKSEIVLRLRFPDLLVEQRQSRRGVDLDLAVGRRRIVDVIGVRMPLHRIASVGAGDRTGVAVGDDDPLDRTPRSVPNVAVEIARTAAGRVAFAGIRRTSREERQKQNARNEISGSHIHVY